MGLRDIVNAIAPPWLKAPPSGWTPDQGGFVGGRLLYSLALVGDLQLEKLTQSVKAWMPTKTQTETSLPLIGEDRLIPQGPSEPSASYRRRLQRAFDDWFFAGSPRAIIAQLLGYLTPVAPRVLVVSNTGAWDYVDAGSTPETIPTHVPVGAGFLPAGNWSWDTVSIGPWDSTLWFRIWVVLDGAGWCAPPRLWDDGWKWDDGTCWDSASPQSTFDAVRALVALWKAQHAVCASVIVSRDATKFQPTDAPGSANNPDGQYLYWSKIVGTTRVAARTLDAMYLEGMA